MNSVSTRPQHWFFDLRYLIRKSASPRAARRFSGVASTPRLSHSFTDHLNKKKY
jgi:hypothetical protein